MSTHKYTDTQEKATSLAYNATCDIESVSASPLYSTIGDYIKFTKSAVQKSLLSIDKVNSALYDALKIRF